MHNRNLSPNHMFTQLAMEHRPLSTFAGTTDLDFCNWKKDTWPKVLATLGIFPERVPLDPLLLAEWEHDGLKKQRWVIDVGRHISATFQVNYPVGIEDREKRPAILCWHGHGNTGKDAVMGNDAADESLDEIKRFNCDYGHQMAKDGYITYAIDWIGVGDRNDSRRPHFMSHNAGRDWCNLYYLHATMLGMTSISINVTHGMAATDFACSLPNVDPDRLGVMGLSGGGAMTLWTTLCDKRIKAAEIICCSDLWPYFGMRDLNYCGMQVAPGLFRLVNLHDLQGLLAPMPLLIDIGAYDTCFHVDTAMECFRNLERIYESAGARDRLELDFFPGEHSWGGNKSRDFFGRYL